MSNQKTEWVIDVSCTGDDDSNIAFVPVVGDAVVFGLTCIRDRSPGVLVGVVSQHGVKHAEEWAERNPNWRIDYCSDEELANAIVTS